MPTKTLTMLALALLLVQVPAVAYTVVLKDGSKLIAKEPPEIRDETAIITLQNGTQSSLAASEIDLERTRDANQSELGSALILEGGEFTAQPTSPQPPKQEDRLTDLARVRPQQPVRRPAGSTFSGSRSGSGESQDLLGVQRRPYRNLEIAAEIQGIFRGQGVDQTRLYQGTTAKRVLVDLTADSEAAVFRGLKVAATAFTHLQTTFPGSIDLFELVLTTSSRDRAGQFVLDGQLATHLLDGSIEPSAFYVEHVQF